MDPFPYLTPNSDGTITLGVPDADALPDHHHIPAGVDVQVLKNFDPELDSDEFDGIPVTSPERTLVDCADFSSPLEIASYIERAAAMDLFDEARYLETNRRVQHERGSWVAQHALELWHQYGLHESR